MATGREIAEAGTKYLGVSYDTMDCQAFVERCLKDCGISKDLAGSNAWYRFLMQNGWVGSPEACKSKFGSIPVGAFLFICEQNGKEPAKYIGDGVGNVSHIGLYTGMKGKEMVRMGLEKGNLKALAYNYGDGGLHSSASRGSVCTTKFSGKTINGGWNRVGLWNRLDYGEHINSLLGSGKKDEVNIVVEYAKVKDGALNLRSEKSTSSERITQIPSGATVGVVEHGSEWCKVVYNAYTGYAMTKFLGFEDSSDKNSNISITLPHDCALALYEALKSSLNK